MRIGAICTLLALLVAGWSTAAADEIGVGGGGSNVRVDAIRGGANRIGRPRISRGANGDAAPVPKSDYLKSGRCAGSDVHFVAAYTRAGVLVNSTGCPAQPASPVEAADQVWHWETELPSPDIAMSPPNRAVTGLDLFLSIAGPMGRTIELNALGYAVHLDISSVYLIDWGDGTETGPHTTQGGPWPDGDLRHQYVKRGEVTITVTQRWTARWSAGDQSGVLRDRLHTESSRTIPVDEIQAVVTG